MAISDTNVDVRHRGLTLEEQAALARAPRLKPEHQWWNIPAKYAKARQIADEELALSRRSARTQGLPNAHNNAFDAMRHARWSQRMAAEIDPATAWVMGGAHELAGAFHGQPWAEAEMDNFNNGEGRRAAAEGRPIDPTRLRTDPSAPGREYPAAGQRGVGHGWRAR